LSRFLSLLAKMDNPQIPFFPTEPNKVLGLLGQRLQENIISCRTTFKSVLDNVTIGKVKISLSPSNPHPSMRMKTTNNVAFFTSTTKPTSSSHFTVGFSPRNTRRHVISLRNAPFASVSAAAEGSESGSASGSGSSDDESSDVSSSEDGNDAGKEKVTGGTAIASDKENVHNAGAAIDTGKNDEEDEDEISKTAAGRVIITEINFTGASDEMLKDVRRVMRVKPNVAYTLKEVAKDLKRINRTGWFSKIVPRPVETREGVALNIELEPYDKVKSLVVTGCTAVPTAFIEESFRSVQGHPMNVRHVRHALSKLQQWYQNGGYLASVSRTTFRHGRLEVHCAEPKVSSVAAQIFDPETQKPIKGVTKPHILQRYLNLKQGDLYCRDTISSDIQRFYGTGLFEDANLVVKEAEYGSSADEPRIDVCYTLVERKHRGMSFGGGFSATPALLGKKSDGGRGEGDLGKGKSGKGGEGGGGGGGGTSMFPSLVGSFSFYDRNLFGLAQRLNVSAELGQSDQVFKISHVDPWVNSGPSRTSRTISLSNNRHASAVHGGPIQPSQGAGGRDEEDGVVLVAPRDRLSNIISSNISNTGSRLGDFSSSVLSPLMSLFPLGKSNQSKQVEGEGEGSSSAMARSGGVGAVVKSVNLDDDRPVLLGRELGSVDYQRPLSQNLTGSLTLMCQRTRVMDERGVPTTHDAFGAPLTASGDVEDRAAAISLGLSYSRNGAAGNTSASAMVEQAVPWDGQGKWQNYSRLRFLLHKPLALPNPLRLPRIPTFHLRLQGGACLGDLPPYEALCIGGTNSVRGYVEGGVGSGRYAAEATTEVRVPLPLKPLTAVAFADFGSDFGSGASVMGNPAGIRGKAGTGAGVGVGMRIASPVGPLRLEYAWNDRRQGQLHIGFGMY